MKQLIQNGKMLSELDSIQRDVDALFKLLSLTMADRVVDWTKEWRVQHNKFDGQMNQLARNVSVIRNSIVELQNDVKKTNNVKKRRNTKYAITPRLTPQWFVQDSEIEYEQDAFVHGSLGSMHRGEWRGNNVMVLGGSHQCSPRCNAPETSLKDYLTESAANKRLLYEAALGLQHVHENRVIHGDLKLSNFVVDTDGHAKRCDFGLSTSVRHRPTSLAKQQSIIGNKVRWRAPECLRNPVYASDVFSFAMHN
ncbi:unnamed protein product [Phytophthora lilii]|uniref:Unnamed protein product n=1 Tax=Phytophthora lilii TaxID=2077276 RepID=A0A9W6X1X4_9STRA|nr:unnamed protein product [Phytophthora lilii]